MSTLEESPSYSRDIVEHGQIHSGMQCLYSALGFSLGLGFGAAATGNS